MDLPDDEVLMLRTLSVAAAVVVNLGSGKPAAEVLQEAKQYEAHLVAPSDPPAAPPG